MSRKHTKYFADNLQFWDAVAKMHAQGSGAEFYRIKEFLQGECKLGPWEDMFEPVIRHYWKLKDGFVPLPMSYTLRA